MMKTNLMFMVLAVFLPSMSSSTPTKFNETWGDGHENGTCGKGWTNDALTVDKSFEEENECFHGMFGSENDWFERYFWTDTLHDTIEIKARVWLLCAADTNEYASLRVDGKELWRKRRTTHTRCDGWEIAERVPWMDRFSCLNRWKESRCFEDVVVYIPHSSIGVENSFAVRFGINGGLNSGASDEAWGISQISVAAKSAVPSTTGLPTKKPTLKPRPIFHMVPLKVTWDDAEDFCEKVIGTSLATIASKEDERMALSLCLSIGKECWIGFHDFQSEGTFEWIDGTQIGYNKPVDNNGPSEDCVGIREGGWFASPCSDPRQSLAFLCNICPMEVMSCPDGSKVARDPRKGCQFAACPFIPTFKPTVEPTEKHTKKPTTSTPLSTAKPILPTEPIRETTQLDTSTTLPKTTFPKTSDSPSTTSFKPTRTLIERLTTPYPMETTHSTRRNHTFRPTDIISDINATHVFANDSSTFVPTLPDDVEEYPNVTKGEVDISSRKTPFFFVFFILCSFQIVFS